MIDIAIIGGSGFYNFDGMKGVKEISVKTPFGPPSDKIITGIISGVKVGFLARHNRKHIYIPSEVPYRANIYALKKLGAKIILSFSAAGSLKEELPPKTLVFPDQLVDKTVSRPSTFFGKGKIGHASFGSPFCACLQKVLFDTAKKLKIKSAKGGVLVCMEGPAYSTRAESEFHRKMGWSLIGMTNSPEAKLAREGGIAYCPINMITDYDCWKDGEVSHDKVIEIMKHNEISAKKILTAALPLIKKMRRCGTCDKAIFSIK